MAYGFGGKEAEAEEREEVDVDDDLPLQTEERSENLLDDHDVCEQLLKYYNTVEKGFSDQWERSNKQMDYWDLYHCILGPNQFYSGNSKIFVPIVHDAINARKVRFTNQIFPQSGKHVDIIASEEPPKGLMSLLEFYIRKAKLRTRVMPALCRNADIEGHFNVYVKWVRIERHVAMRVRKKYPLAVMGPGPDARFDPEDDFDIEGDNEDEVEELTEVSEYPALEVLADCDVCVLPATSDSIDEAIEAGGSVTVIRRWTKDKIRSMIRSGEIDKDAGQALIQGMVHASSMDNPNKAKVVTDAAGIKVEGGGKSFALVYEVWKKLKVKGDYRICRAFLGGEERLLGAGLNPYWCDRVPVLSAPVEKIQGSFKGVPKAKVVETIQYAANDAINEGMDSAAYALMPIVMTDPQRNPRVGSMVLNVAAIWETDPQSTQFAKFPAIWQDAFQLVSAAKEQVFQTLGINPAMMPQQVMAPNKKPNQAMIANEQMVDILTTADSVTVIEEEVLTPALQWFVWLDHQFRDRKMTVPKFGRIGVRMEMDDVPVLQMNKRFEFRWYGVEQARTLQQMQIQMAGLNVLKGIPPEQYQGHRLDLSPLITHWVSNIFGPRLGEQIFIDLKSELAVDVEFENQMLFQGIAPMVHPLDNDMEHMKSHFQAMKMADGDPRGVFRQHIMQHQAQVELKQKQAMMQMMMMMGGGGQQQQQKRPRQGSSGGGGGGPRAGGVSTVPRGGQAPAGMIHQDQMRNAMPRSTRGGSVAG